MENRGHATDWELKIRLRFLTICTQSWIEVSSIGMMLAIVESSGLDPGCLNLSPGAFRAIGAPFAI